MANNGHEKQTASGGALAVGSAAQEAALIRQGNSTPSGVPRQDPLAIWHLGRLMAGAADADLQLIGAAFPDLPLNGSKEANRRAAREYVGTRNALLAQILAQDLDMVPEAAATKSRSFYTARELLGTKFPEPRWIVPDILPEGLAPLAGRPKVGKSWLALQIACAVGTGGSLLGRRVNRGKVLYIALEDGFRRLQNRMQTQLWSPEADVDFYVEWPELTNGGLDRLQAEITAKGYTLVILDTLSRIVCFDQQDVTPTTAVMGALQHLALACRCTILVVDHHRKRGAFDPDPVEDLLGSTGKAAVSDTILGLFRERGKPGAQLHVTGRDMPDQQLALRWDTQTCCWQIDENATAATHNASQLEVLEALRELEGEATTSDLATHLGKDKSQISRTLAELITTGDVRKGQRTGREVPYRLTDLPASEDEDEGDD